MSSHCRVLSFASSLLAALAAGTVSAQTVTIDTSEAGLRQVIDGFGTCLSGTEGESEWFQRLYFDDLQSSILRFDITPNFTSPYSDFVYNSPWFGSDPELPGPEGNNVRTYADAASYNAEWYGRRAPIAVMGPDIEHNVQYFTYENDGPRVAGALAQLGTEKRADLGDFKLVASMWSPAAWLKVSSGNTISGQTWPLPVDGAAWPFIWGGNFSRVRRRRVHGRPRRRLVGE